MSPLLAPTPALALLAAAAERCGAAGQRLYRVIADQYPDSLERRPGQLLRAADATAEELDRLLATAGFADTDELRSRAGREANRRLAAPDLRFTHRESAPGDRAALRRIIAAEQENLARTLGGLLSNGALELAAAAILGARRRWVIGDLKSTGYAALIASDLAPMLRDVTVIQPGSAAAVNALADAHPQDSLIAYSFRKYGRLTLRVAREFHEMGATVIALTDSYTSPICAHATHILAVDTRSEAPHHSPTAVTATGHVLAALAAAGAKGAGRRERRRAELAESLECYADRPERSPGHPPAPTTD
ncbi:MurR/RpiR family transcriptional regulator [Peterkaempfera sp. SMS 1(5)a]|uniref:MurR/RpiR family transcriptional regulator n=1 Tax=Peterkaempfera podocarpi TaxID=3232308 RepID=UPI00366B4FA8